MPLYSDALLAVITYELLCVAACVCLLSVLAFVRLHLTCVSTFNLKLLS